MKVVIKMEENKSNNLIGVVISIILVCSLAFNVYSLVKKPEVQFQNSGTDPQKEVSNQKDDNEEEPTDDKNNQENDQKEDQKEDQKDEHSNNQTTNNSTPSSTECVTSNEVTAANIKSVYKSYMVALRTVDFNNLRSWNLAEVTYVGYIKNTNTRIYSISGTYLCKDKSSDCVYQEQIGDVSSNGEVSFKNAFDVEVADDGSVLFQTMDVTYSSNPNFVSVNQKLK